MRVSEQFTLRCRLACVLPRQQDEKVKLLGVGEEFVKQKQRIVKAETDAVR